MQYTHIYLGLIEFQAQIMLKIWAIFKGDSPSRSRLGSQKYLHIVDKNTSTMLTKIPPQFGQKYLHNGDKNTSTMVTKIPPQLRKNQKKWWNINKQLHTLEKNFFYKSCFFLYEYYKINV